MSLITKQRINTNLSGDEQFFPSGNVKIFPCAYRGYWEEFTQEESTENFHRDGSTNTFTLTNRPVKIISITVTGEENEEEPEYTLTDSTITLATTPSADADTKIEIKYIYLSNTTKNQGFDPEAQATTEYNLTNLYGKLSSNKESYIVSFTSIGNDKYLLKCVIGGYYFEINNVEVNDIKDKYLGIKLREFDLENSDNDSDRKSKLLESLIDNDYYLDVKADDSYAFTGLAVVSSTIGYNYALKVVISDGDTWKLNWRENTILNALDTGSGKYSIQNLNEDNAYNCVASGNYAAALGTATVSKNTNAIAVGNNTKTNMDEQVVLGKFNTESNDAYLVIGNGTDNSNRKNVVEVKTDGKIITKGDLVADGSSRTNTLTLGNTETNNSGAIDVYGNSTTKVFTVDNAGNTSTAGTLTATGNFTVGTNKLTVNAADGNTDVGGTLTVDGTLSVKSNTTVSGNITANKSGTNTLSLGSTTNNSSGELKIYGTGTNTVFTVNNSGAVALAGGISAGGKITSSSTTAADSNTTVITKDYLVSYVTDRISGKADSSSVSSSVNTLDGKITAAVSKAESELSAAISTAKEELNGIINQAKTDLTTAINTAKGEVENKIDTDFSSKEATASSSLGSGKYIVSVSQSNGQITATEGSFSTSVVINDTANAPTGCAVAEHVSSVKTELENKIESVLKYCIKSAVLDAAYPVGSIYMKYSSTPVGTCPIETSLGGTWEKIDTGKFLVSASGDNSGIYAPSYDGGSANAIIVSHGHTLTKTSVSATTEGAGKHTHNVSYKASKAGTGSWTGFEGNAGDKDDGKVTETTTEASAHTHSVSISLPTINTTGEDGTNKNLPPYIAVYMWWRTA